MLSALEVANYFLISEDEIEKDITNLKLNKLMYYAQGFHLAIKKEPLFNEDIEAWTHGPVVPDIYHHFKNYGANPLQPTMGINVEEIDPETKEILDEIYDVFGQYSASTLRNWTHNEPPWSNTPNGSVISKESLEKYFETRIEK